MDKIKFNQPGKAEKLDEYPSVRWILSGVFFSNKKKYIISGWSCQYYMLMLKIKPCMCKFKDQVGWNCGRLIITVIVSLVSRYKDNFVNDKANTWDDPGSIYTFRPSVARPGLNDILLWKRMPRQLRKATLLTSNQWEFLIYQFVGSIEDYQDYNG